MKKEDLIPERIYVWYADNNQHTRDNIIFKYHKNSDLIKFISLVNNARVGSCCGLNYNPCHVIFEEASYTELVEFYKFFPKEQKEKIPEMFKIY